MTAPDWLRARFGSWPAALLTVGWLLLAAWACGIAVAAFALDSWRQEISRTVLQLNADAQFRARVNTREAVDPEWYRRKALALLSATERLQRDTTWSLFVPGSWHAFDNLEEQLQDRLSREFADIVVETMRRELFLRASKLTGVPLVRGSGELQAGTDCESPVPQNHDRQLTAAAHDLPEFVAVADYVAAVERLDEAVQSFQSLQYAGGQADHLRKLVAYTLNQQLPGALAGAVRMFHSGDEVNLQPALMQNKLQWATRCSLAKAMSALHTRLLQTNDLFSLEQAYVERSNGLFEPAGRTQAFDRTLERLRAVHTLLEDQHTLLARGHNDWMGQGTLQLGRPYQEVLQRVQRMRLLGPDVVRQLDNQSGAAFAEFRRQFEQAFGSHGEPGIVWLEADKRFGLSPERAALREGLAGLLQVSFFSEEATKAAAQAAREHASLARVAQEARTIALERERVLAEVVPVFPEDVHDGVVRVVDTRVSDLIWQRASRSLKASLPEPQASFDAAAFRQQREHVLALQSLLKDSGAPGLGDKLVAMLDGELLRRLAKMQEEWRQQPLHASRLDDFAWWQGEPLALASLLAGADSATATATTAAAPPTLQRTAAGLDHLLKQASPLLALGSPTLAASPAAARWSHWQAELDRYNAHAADSSLARLERYALALGPDLRRENCGERLATHTLAAAPADDDIAQRHQQLHQALTRRCTELRAQALQLTPSLSPLPAPAASLAQ